MKQQASSHLRKLKKGKSDEHIPTHPPRCLFGHHRHSGAGRVDCLDAVHRQSDTLNLGWLRREDIEKDPCTLPLTPNDGEEEKNRGLEFVEF